MGAARQQDVADERQLIEKRRNHLRAHLHCYTTQAMPYALILVPKGSFPWLVQPWELVTLVQHHNTTGRRSAWCEKPQAHHYSPAFLKTSPSCSLTELQSFFCFFSSVSFWFILFYRTLWSNEHHGCNTVLHVCAERCHAHKPTQLSRNWDLNEHLQWKLLGPGNLLFSLPAVGHSMKDSFSQGDRGKVAG